jgi:hypothetical protein
MLIKKIIMTVYYTLLVSSLIGQENILCPIHTPHNAQQLVEWLNKVESKQKNTGCYSSSDSSCFKLLTQYLWTETDHKPDESFNTILTLWLHYRSWYHFIEDTLALRVISNKLRHTKTLIGGAPDDQYGDMNIAAKFSIGFIGKMVVARGKKSIPILLDLLEDEQKVGYGGSSSETQWVYSRYQFRRKDFAYFYLASILGEVPMAMQSQSGRDAIIKQFVEKYKTELLKK